MLEMRGRSDWTWLGRARRLSVAVATLALMLLLAGCAKSTPLPDLVKDPKQVLTKDEQKRAIADISQGKDQAVNAAEKQIEKGR